MKRSVVALGSGIVLAFVLTNRCRQARFKDTTCRVSQVDLFRQRYIVCLWGDQCNPVSCIRGCAGVGGCGVGQGRWRGAEPNGSDDQGGRRGH